MKNTICLVMIVKNESKILDRCFSTIKNIIDYWVIVDTGSTDNTKEIINQELKDIPGELHEKEWVNFGHNRTEALKLAKNKANYLLLCDADEQIIPLESFDVNKLAKDQYKIRYTGSLDYAIPYLIKGNIDWRFEGVTHEFLTTDKIISSDTLDNIVIKDWGDGGSKADKFVRDIKLLEDGLVQEPNNVRYMFYLANSYKNIKDYKNAIKWYQRRINAGGWKEEVTCSYEYLGICYKENNQHEHAITTWLKGYDYNPQRAECIYEAGKLLRELQNNKAAFVLLMKAKEIEYPKEDILFIKRDVYEYLIDYEISICAFYNQHDLDMSKIYKKLLFETNKDWNNLISNFKFYKQDIKSISHKVIDIEKNYIEKLENYNISSPGISKNGNDFLINVRNVSYGIHPDGNYYDINTKKPGKVNTINGYFKIDNEYNYIRDSYRLFNNDNTELDKWISGIEDVKIFNYQDEMFFTGTKWIEYANISIVAGKYDLEKNNLEHRNLKSPLQNKVEKNWSPFIHNDQIKYIYSWDPIRICKEIDNSSEMIIEKTLNKSFRNLRGSSPGLIIDEKYWFITHFVEYSQPRHYYQIIVRFDLDMNYYDHSIPFKFDKENNIEYCVGIEYNDKSDEIIIPYSSNDANAKILILNKMDLIKFLKFSK